MKKTTRVRLELKPVSVIEADLGIDADGEIQAFFTETCYKAMDKYVPKSLGTDGGKLRDEVTLTPSQIIYNMDDYSFYQYYGMRKDGSHVVRNYSTPGTTSYWDVYMWASDKEKVIRQTQDELDKRNGGSR